MDYNPRTSITLTGCNQVINFFGEMLRAFVIVASFNLHPIFGIPSFKLDLDMLTGLKKSLIQHGEAQRPYVTEIIPDVSP